MLTARSALTVRAEHGARVSRPLLSGIGSDSDTGSWAAEWQASAGRLTAFTRYSRRDNVDRMNGSAGYRQHDGSAQLFANVTRSAQVFATTMVTTTHLPQSGGRKHVLAGGRRRPAARPRRDLWLRAEGTLSRNVDLVTHSFVPRESLSLGLNGQVTRHMMLAFNVNIDRALLAQSGSPWMTRSNRAVDAHAADGFRLHDQRGCGIRGHVGPRHGFRHRDRVCGLERERRARRRRYAARRNPDANRCGHSTTGRDGQFSFLNVPVGTRDVGLDTGSLPVDFDPPAIAQFEVDITRGDTRRISFGLLPLGSIHGRVIRDANGNGKADPARTQSMERSWCSMAACDPSRRERRALPVRRGPKRRALVKLLIDSLPEGALIAGRRRCPRRWRATRWPRTCHSWCRSRNARRYGRSFRLGEARQPTPRGAPRQPRDPRGSGAANGRSTHRRRCRRKRGGGVRHPDCRVERSGAGERHGASTQRCRSAGVPAEPAGRRSGCAVQGARRSLHDAGGRQENSRGARTKARREGVGDERELVVTAR